MGRIQTGVRALAACAALALAFVGCSGGISLAGDGDDDIRPSTDVEDGTCPANALSGGRCSVEGSTCETAVFCQRCAAAAWTLRSANCWCWDGTWGCDHVDCRPPYAGTYSDPDCTVPWGADGDADADADPDADADADVGDCVPPCPSGFTCYYGVCVPASADADADADADVDHGAEADAHLDADVDADVAEDVVADIIEDVAAGDDSGADHASDADVCSGAWEDPTTGYLWENPPPTDSMDWDDAIAYCNGLSLCGYPAGAWHVPTISELRSFIRGCPATITGRACGVTDSCLDGSCWSLACYDCWLYSGPGDGGCYWDPAVGGGCWEYWSSSSETTDDFHYAYYAWRVYFANGGVVSVGKTGLSHVRCVRPGP